MPPSRKISEAPSVGKRHPDRYYRQKPVKPKVWIPESIPVPKAGGEPHRVFIQEEKSKAKIQPSERTAFPFIQQPQKRQIAHCAHEDGGDQVARIISPLEEEQAGSDGKGGRKISPPRLFRLPPLKDIPKKQAEKQEARIPAKIGDPEYHRRRTLKRHVQQPVQVSHRIAGVKKGQHQ